MTAGGSAHPLGSQSAGETRFLGPVARGQIQVGADDLVPQARILDPDAQLPGDFEIGVPVPEPHGRGRTGSFRFRPAGHPLPFDKSGIGPGRGLGNG